MSSKPESCCARSFTETQGPSVKRAIASAPLFRRVVCRDNHHLETPRRQFAFDPFFGFAMDFVMLQSFLVCREASTSFGDLSCCDRARGFGAHPRLAAFRGREADNHDLLAVNRFLGLANSLVVRP